MSYTLVENFLVTPGDMDEETGMAVFCTEHPIGSLVGMVINGEVVEFPTDGEEYKDADIEYDDDGFIWAALEPGDEIEVCYVPDLSYYEDEDEDFDYDEEGEEDYDGAYDGCIKCDLEDLQEQVYALCDMCEALQGQIEVLQEDAHEHLPKPCFHFGS